MKKSELRRLIKEEIQVVNETIMDWFFIAVYSKASNKENFKKILQKNPKDPPIDMSQHSVGGPMGTPEEIRKHLKKDVIKFIGKDFQGTISYSSGKWKIDKIL